MTNCADKNIFRYQHIAKCMDEKMKWIQEKLELSQKEVMYRDMWMKEKDAYLREVIQVKQAVLSCRQVSATTPRSSNSC